MSLEIIRASASKAAAIKIIDKNSDVEETQTPSNNKNDDSELLWMSKNNKGEFKKQSGINYTKKSIASVDEDKSGDLNYKEFEKLENSTNAAIVDTNKDGKIDLKEETAWNYFKDTMGSKDGKPTGKITQEGIDKANKAAATDAYKIRIARETGTPIEKEDLTTNCALEKIQKEQSDNIKQGQTLSDNKNDNSELLWMKKNNNGKLTMQSGIDYTKKAIASVDEDKSGDLSYKEFEKLENSKNASVVDTNKDGKIDLKEETAWNYLKDTMSSKDGKQTGKITQEGIDKANKAATNDANVIQKARETGTPVPIEDLTTNCALEKIQKEQKSKTNLKWN